MFKSINQITRFFSKKSALDADKERLAELNAIINELQEEEHGLNNRIKGINQIISELSVETKYTDVDIMKLSLKSFKDKREQAIVDKNLIAKDIHQAKTERLSIETKINLTKSKIEISRKETETVTELVKAQEEKSSLATISQTSSRTEVSESKAGNIQEGPAEKDYDEWLSLDDKPSSIKFRL